MKDTIELIDFLTQQIQRERILIANAEQDIYNGRRKMEYLQDLRRRMEDVRAQEKILEASISTDKLDS